MAFLWQVHLVPKIEKEEPGLLSPQHSRQSGGDVEGGCYLHLRPLGYKGYLFFKVRTYQDVLNIWSTQNIIFDLVIFVSNMNKRSTWTMIYVTISINHIWSTWAMICVWLGYFCFKHERLKHLGYNMWLGHQKAGKKTSNSSRPCHSKISNNVSSRH